MAKIVNKEKALAALLEETSLTSAAAAAGLDRKTLYNYLRKDSDFALEYKRQRELRNIERGEQAEKERETALAAIREIMNDNEQPGAVRLKAAEKLLDIANSGISAQQIVAQAIWDSHTGFSFDDKVF